MRKPASNLARAADGERVVPVRGKLKKGGWDCRFLLKLINAASGLPKEAEAEEIQTR